MSRTRRPRSRSADGADVSRLILRATLGGTMIAHGIRHGRTLDGTAGWFGSLGFRRPRLQAQLSSAVEVGAGSALLSGAATPVAASAVIGTMSVAFRTVHLPNGYFVINEGWEYVGFISAASLALAALGAGRFSIDRRLGLDAIGTPGARALFAAGLGAGGAIGQLVTFWSKPPAKA